MAVLLTSFEDQVALHSLQTEGINSAAHHGVPHRTLVAVDVHQTVVPRNLRGTKGMNPFHAEKLFSEYTYSFNLYHFEDLKKKNKTNQSKCSDYVLFAIH